MRMNPPRLARLIVYGVNALGSPVVAYCLARGWIGEMELALWSAEVTAAFALAGLNVPEPRD